MDPFDFGMTLRNLRKQKKLTQQQLADKLSISVTAVSKYESNVALPPFEAMRTLSFVFNVSMDYLYGIETKGTISTHGLTPSQIQLQNDLSEAFKTNNLQYNKDANNEKYILIGRVVAELLK